MPYFSKITRTLATKNKLEAAVQDMLKKYNRKVIADAELTTFKNEVNKEIEQQNAAFPRCTPVKIYWWNDTPYSSNNCKDWHLSLGFSELSIYQAK